MFDAARRARRAVQKQLPSQMLSPLHAAARAARRMIGGARTPRWYGRDEAIMGTAIRVELLAGDAALADEAIDKVMAEMRRIDAAMSPYKDTSELSLVNREAGRRPVRLSAELFDLVQRAIRFSELSGGAFDITYAAAGHLYDYRRGARPGTQQVAAARDAIGWQHLRLDSADRSLRFARPGMRIDLGGFAKGHAVNTSVAILASLGIRHAMVSAGGDSRLLGDRGGRPWSIGVRHPRQERGVAAVLPLADCAVSTSGDYERCFTDARGRCHHLIDPRTGEPAQGAASVTVIAPDGLLAEALSKTVFVLGPTAGLPIVESMHGCDAVAVDGEGRLFYSAGLQAGAGLPVQQARQ